MHLNGYNNAKTVLDWALENFPDPEQLVIGGYSAGSLGAQIWSVKAAKMWEVGQRGTRCRRADLACVPDRGGQPIVRPLTPLDRCYASAFRR
ncbi:hypothetical protein PF010_g32432 [Phytophthora fragariae]|uniref:Uncharacterized protein n=1 Tax=Phytophthora fragariae TaxID=53985 RepID=A0A6G0JEJ4_9STRA|nr:hypothetical protein PF010_g32432 [Phytophthora fragariae]